MKYILLFLTFCIQSSLFAQLEGNNWIMGTSKTTWDTAEWACVKMDFRHNPPQVTKFPSFDLYMDVTNTNVSDKNGDLLLFSNGLRIIDTSLTPIHGNTVFPNDSIGINTTYPVSQGGLLLNFDVTKLMFVFSEITKFYFPDSLNRAAGSAEMNYSSILLNDQGKYVLKNKETAIINTDTMPLGQLTATRHANGRDWWLLSSKYNQNKYYSILAEPDTAYVAHSENIGGNTRTSLGQAVFSPDGNHFARYNTVAFPFSAWVDIYDFDRCSGRLSNPRNFQVADNIQYGGIAFSENSRFLYAAVFDTVYQYDMWAADVENSAEIVAVYDGFKEIYANLELPTRFFLMQLAPDGKIYISVPNYSCSYLHVIESPNEKGVACNFKQHSFKLPTFNRFGIPNHPYYGLGALAGSPCDTLGLSAQQEPEKSQNYVTLSPNPTYGHLKIELLDFEKNNLHGASILFFDGLGKEVFKMKFQNEKILHIDLAGLASGLYFYVVQDKNGHSLQVGKVLKL